MKGYHFLSGARSVSGIYFSGVHRVMPQIVSSERLGKNSGEPLQQFSQNFRTVVDA
jgi:hypothetical protein